MSNSNIVSSHTGNCKKFDCSQHVFEINFEESNTTFGESNTKINELFSNIHIIKIVELINDSDYARIIFIHDDLDHPIGYTFMNKETLLTTNLQTIFDSVIQSKFYFLKEIKSLEKRIKNLILVTIHKL